MSELDLPTIADDAVETMPREPRVPSGLINRPQTDMPNMENYHAAHAELDMTPEEQALYMRHLGNVTGPGGVDHPDGGRSTLYQMSTQIGDRVYNIPTVWDGKIVPPEQALKLAFMEGINKFPSYASIDDAEARYMAMHRFMDMDIARAKGAKQ